MEDLLAWRGDSFHKVMGLAAHLIAVAQATGVPPRMVPLPRDVCRRVAVEHAVAGAAGPRNAPQLVPVALSGRNARGSPVQREAGVIFSNEGLGTVERRMGRASEAEGVRRERRFARLAEPEGWRGLQVCG